MNAFVRKISLWTQKIRQENIFDMFPCLCKCKADNLNLDQVKNVIIAHLNGLQERFQHYFAEIDVTKYDWIRNPFLADPSTSGLYTQEEEQLIDLSSDQSLKMVFHTTPVPTFWISINGEYPLLSEKAMKVLLPFSTSYMCEQGFSALAALKSKYRNRVDAEAELRIAVGTNIAHRFASLCHSKQAQPSH